MLSPVPEKEVSELELRLRDVTAHNVEPEKEVSALELRLRAWRALRFPWVIPKAPMRLFHEKSSDVTSLSVHVTPVQLQAVVDTRHHSLFIQFRPPLVSKISSRAPHCTSPTSVILVQKEGHITLRVLHVSSAFVLSQDDVAPPSVISERQLLVIVRVAGVRDVTPERRAILLLSNERLFKAVNPVPSKAARRFELRLRVVSPVVHVISKTFGDILSSKLLWRSRVLSPVIHVPIKVVSLLFERVTVDKDSDEFQLKLREVSEVKPVPENEVRALLLKLISVTEPSPVLASVVNQLLERLRVLRAVRDAGSVRAESLTLLRLILLLRFSVTNQPHPLPEKVVNLLLLRSRSVKRGLLPVDAGIEVS